MRRKDVATEIPEWARQPQQSHWITEAEAAGDVLHVRLLSFHRFGDALELVGLREHPARLLRWPAAEGFGQPDQTVPPPPAALVRRVREHHPDRNWQTDTHHAVQPAPENARLR